MSIEQWQQPRADLTLASMQDNAVARLGEWAQSADAAYNVAQRLSDSSFVPAQFKGKPIELTAAILAGLEVGLSPMAAMRSFDIIQGTAAPRAITLRAVVQSHGHEMVVEESNAARCKMKGRRKGSSEWQPVLWTIERAQALGLTSKDGWKKQPTAMLLARATSELARIIASDAILGIGYSSEEVADGPLVEDTIATEAPAAGTRKMSRRPRAVAPAPEPVEDAEPSITPDQLKKLHTVLTNLSMERDDALGFYAGTVGHDVDSSKSLTKAEASRVIDALKRLESGQPEEPIDGEVMGE